MNIRLLSWGDYLYIGLAFAVILFANNEYQDGFSQVVVVVIFFLLTGFECNIRMLRNFIKKYPLFAILTTVWTVYFAFVNRGERTSYKYAITVFFIIFAGYCVSMSGRTVLSEALEKLWTVIFILLATGFVNYMIVHNFNWRSYMFFLNPIAEGDAAIAMTLISVYYIEDKRKKIAGIFLALITVITGALRLDAIVLISILLVFAWLKRKEIKIYLRGKIIAAQYSRIALVVVCLAVLVSAFLVTTKTIELTTFSYFIDRYKSLFASLIKDVYLDYFGDYSLKIRIVAIDRALKVFRDGNLPERFFGGGILYGYYSIKPFMTLFTGASGLRAGPIENAFVALLADFGALAFILYFGVFVASISTAFRTQNEHVRCHSLFVIFMMSVSAFIDMEYWINLIFFVWIFIGIYLGELVQAKAERVLITALIFASVLAAILYYFPLIYSIIRTVINASIVNTGKSSTIILAILTLIDILVVIWSVCEFAVCYIFEKIIVKSDIVAVSVGAILLIFSVIYSYIQVRGVDRAVTEKILAEKETLKVIRDSAVGNVYNDTFPLIYSEQIGDVKGTLFSGACLAASEETTVIMDINDEAQRLTNTGFLYLPISEDDAIYTNDIGVISALRAEGYNPTGYYPLRREVNLEEEAAKDGLEMTDSGAVILDGPEKSMSNGVATDIYPGKFTATFNLRFESGADESDKKVCTLIIKQKDAENVIATADIMKSMFDVNSELSYDIPFTGGKAECIFLVQMDIDEKMEVDSISYIRTPDTDVHVRIDNYGRTTLEEFFDLDGNPIEASGGYHAVEYEYEGEGTWVRRCFLDADLKPVISASGYAEMKRVIDGSQRVIREEYYGVDGKPIALSRGQVAESYERDDDGNITLLTYLGEDGKPILTDYGYAILRRVFDKDKHVLKEEYFDADFNPVTLKRGQAFVEYDYDENGNRTAERYFDAVGKPALYNGQYYCVKRTYNELNQNILEEYFGTDEEPIALSDNASGYRREYDSAGNVSLIECLGADGKPVINTSGYAIMKREFNDKKQPILEMYYGVDMEPVYFSNNAAGYRKEYDEYDNIISLTYLDADGKPTMTPWGCSRWHRIYNDKGQVLREEYYDTEDVPVACSGGQGVEEYEYDDAGNRTIIRYYDADGMPVLYNGEYWYIVYTYNERDQIIHEDYYGLDNRLIMRAAGYCSVDIRYNEFGVAEGKTYFDLDGVVVFKE